MRSASLFAVLAAGVFVSACAQGPREPAAPEAEPSFYRPLDAAGAELDAEAARDMISIYRHNAGLAPLALDAALTEAARVKAAALARKDALARGGAKKAQEDDLSRRESRAARADIVSAGYRTLAEAFSGWRQSPPDNAKLLNRRFARMGVATAFAPGSKYKVYWTVTLAE